MEPAVKLQELERQLDLNEDFGIMVRTSQIGRATSDSILTENLLECRGRRGGTCGRCRGQPEDASPRGSPDDGRPSQKERSDQRGHSGKSDIDRNTGTAAAARPMPMLVSPVSPNAYSKAARTYLIPRK